MLGVNILEQTQSKRSHYTEIQAWRKYLKHSKYIVHPEQSLPHVTMDGEPLDQTVLQYYNIGVGNQREYWDELLDTKSYSKATKVKKEKLFILTSDRLNKVWTVQDIRLEIKDNISFIEECGVVCEELNIALKGCKKKEQFENLLVTVTEHLEGLMIYMEDVSIIKWLFVYLPLKI